MRPSAGVDRDGVAGGDRDEVVDEAVDGLDAPGRVDGAEATRNRIVAAAIDEFAEKGFAGARVDSIAERAGVAKPLLYRYFGNKELLYDAVLVKTLSERTDFLVSSAPEDLDQWLARALDALDTSDVREWMRLLSWEALERGDEPVVREEMRRKHLATRVELFESFQRAGTLDRDLPPAELLLGLLGLAAAPVMFPQLARLITGESPEEERFKAAYRALVLGIGRRLGDAAPPA